MIRRAGALVAVCLAAASEFRGECPSGSTSVAWPAANPVWDLCFRRPAATTYLADGAGLEISNVRYRGILALKVANIPIVNVFYAPGGCGPCYRDWFYQERAFQCAPEVLPGLCSGSSTPPQTVCQHPGTDAGTFLGVAVEDLGDRLKLTSQAEAGWYRYIPVWEFFPDGTLRGRFDATSINNGCVAFTHSHHAYFRLDVDAGAAAGNVLDFLPAGGGAQRILQERTFSDSGTSRSRWRVSRTGSPSSVEISRDAGDGGAADPPFFPGDMPVADGWALVYKPTELDDSSVATGCEAGLNGFVSGERLDGSDLVLWVRAGAVHQGEPGGITSDCSLIGPTIRVVIDEAPAAASYDTVTPCRVLDTRGAAGPTGGPGLTGATDRTFVLAGACGIPLTARAVSANLTVVGAASAGHLVIWPDGGPVPPTSALNFGPGRARANNVLLALGAAGGVRVHPLLPVGSVQFILDVTGYFQ